MKVVIPRTVPRDKKTFFSTPLRCMTKPFEVRNKFGMLSKSSKGFVRVLCSKSFKSEVKLKFCFFPGYLQKNLEYSNVAETFSDACI